MDFPTLNTKSARRYGRFWNLPDLSVTGLLALRGGKMNAELTHLSEQPV